MNYLVGLLSPSRFFKTPSSYYYSRFWCSYRVGEYKNFPCTYLCSCTTAGYTTCSNDNLILNIITANYDKLSWIFIIVYKYIIVYYQKGVTVRRVFYHLFLRRPSNKYYLLTRRTRRFTNYANCTVFSFVHEFIQI